MTVELKYSKSSSFYLSCKKDFFSENALLLNNALNQNKLYSSQPFRDFCKLCGKPLNKEPDFTSHSIEYSFCPNCSHLNGKHSDTKSFIQKLYISNTGSDYSINYIDKEYYKRTTEIYIPKVDFLISSIPLRDYNILDVGCGGGYFVYAAMIKNINAKGLDVSEALIDFGNQQISNLSDRKSIKLGDSKPLFYKNELGFFDEIVNSEADVISAIGVIEHLREPHKFFEAFNKSKAQYLYYSVPMFSFSVILENSFNNIFPRQLSGGHTHLFTEESIKMMNEIIQVKSISEWRFGTDIMDLYRSLIGTLKSNNSSLKLIEYLENGFGSKVDELQSVLDKNHFCSEIHIVATKK